MREMRSWPARKRGKKIEEERKKKLRKKEEREKPDREREKTGNVYLIGEEREL